MLLFYIAKLGYHLKENTDSSFLNLLLNTIPDPIFYKNSAGIYKHCNSAFSELILGIPKEKIIGKSLFDIPEYIPYDLAKIYKEKDDELFNNPGTQVYESDVKCKDGKLRRFKFHKATLYNEENQIIGLVGVMLDLTEVYNSRREIEEKDKFIINQSKQAAMGEMIDLIAHQWKGPISTIRMLADYNKLSLDKNEVDPTLISEDLEKVILQADHLVNTIDEFRKFFRPNHEIEEISIKSAIKSALLLVRDELQMHNIITNISIEKELNIFMNSNDIKHIFINLILNSKDAFKENKIRDREINFFADKTDEETIIYVEDNAGGIDEEIIGKIFLPHFTTKPAGKGTGIGLYLVNQILEKYGANISVSCKMSGTSFKIVFKNN